MKAPDAFALRQASMRARLLAVSGGFRPDEWEDLRQEMLLDLLRRAPKFDTNRGDWHSFVCGIIRNHACILFNRNRLRAHEILYGDFTVAENSVADGSIDMRAWRCSEDAESLLRRVDIWSVVERLPEKLRQLAFLLSQMPVRDVCEQTGRSRSRVYQMTKQIREAFVNAGLEPRGRLGDRRKSDRSIGSFDTCSHRSAQTASKRTDA
jgi:RNA polymerase sigma-70 factor, ECF subfamily